MKPMRTVIVMRAIERDGWHAMVEAAFCQPAETYERAATERRRLRLFTLHYCTIVAVSATSDTTAHVGRGAVL